MTVKVKAFGALNHGSYEMFAECLERSSAVSGINVELVSADSYPNKEGVSAVGRPLRAEALESDIKKQELFIAVAADAQKIGAGDETLNVMPCMSMIGFHDGIEKEFGHKIVRLADALVTRYKNVDKVGVIHMRPAKKRVEEMFGAKAVTPDAAQAAKLLAAEEEGRRIKSSAPVEAVMREIAESWKEQGIKHILFARADAPKAQKSAAGQVAGVEISSYFDILADYIV